MTNGLLCEHLHSNQIRLSRCQINQSIQLFSRGTALTAVLLYQYNIVVLISDCLLTRRFCVFSEDKPRTLARKC
jgi:hypothetical protein